MLDLIDVERDPHDRDVILGPCRHHSAGGAYLYAVADPRRGGLVGNAHARILP
ncbi:MAG: hypothetical protein L0K86_17150 [Actinomycetia bacterium]|nr:hypothetical protein [Actinomycetes bacterium]